MPAFLPNDQIVLLASKSLNNGLSFASFLLQCHLDNCLIFDERCTLMSIDTGCPLSSAVLNSASSLDLLFCSLPSFVLLLKKEFSSQLHCK